MKLYEYEAAEIFTGAGICFPEYKLAKNPAEAFSIAKAAGCPVMIKAQILSGGRGLAGGVLEAISPADAGTAAEKILTTPIKGYIPEKVIVAKKIAVEKEIYAGITIDTHLSKPVILIGADGGMNVEKSASKKPGGMVSAPMEPGQNIFPFMARELIKKAGFSGILIPKLADLLVRLGVVFNDYHAFTAEINPVAVTPDGTVYALDAKIEIDDSAIPRISGKIPDPLSRISNEIEKKGKEIGVSYVELDGDIGIIASGAGLGMATVDAVKKMGLNPANFLETGGGITEKLMYETMKLMMLKPGLRAVLINLYGGINPIDDGAKGIVRFIRENGVKIPVLVKALGNRQEETWDILTGGGITVVKDAATEKAVEKLIEKLNG